VGDDTNIGMSIKANGGSHTKSSRARKTASTITERIKGASRVDEQANGVSVAVEKML